MNENTNAMPPEEQAENDRDARAEELESTFSYDGYQVVRKELFAHLRDPAIVIRKDSITFNTACITGLEDVVYVHVMFNSDLKRIVVRGCDENDNYSMGMQVTGKADFIAQYLESGDLYGMIVSIIKTMPGAPVIMVVVLLTMIAFYATSFDSIALTASCYSYHTLEDGEQPNKGIQLMWCILLILLPIALLFAESSMNNLQSVSIVAAFPIGAVIVMIAVSFMKDAKKYMEELGNKK